MFICSGMTFFDEKLCYMATLDVLGYPQCLPYKHTRFSGTWDNVGMISSSPLLACTADVYCKIVPWTHVILEQRGTKI